ncbi:hypothetical protein EJ06DRAFT_546942 [Trichodelitschia bisporula]|uniref:Splicing factor U2AF subunit n=1 Tax=Trichodelitschia bisporula TaxID=703511 RepID=A0A6G1I6K8_9PEZI|nr:hypothetical protein EJ06DRAFT_546942 [Trichodelitschia bisporula]
MNGAVRGGRQGSGRDYHSSRGDRDDRRGDRDRSDRRRSRSPGGHRTARRDYDGDTYSSSRDYRAREREDRYAGRERREDRGWDRDRAPRRDRRGGEEEGDRAGRRDRGDLFDDRRGGGRRGDRDGGRGQERKRSLSPQQPKKKEPTPDLTDVVSVLTKPRRMPQWDLKPPGYENVTAEQAKLSGMFPLPGQPRQQPMDPSRLQAFINAPSGIAAPASLKPTHARQSKRLFINNFPASATNESILEFFNLQLNGLNVISAPDPCTLAQISADRSYALLEFKQPSDATVALALDGITMEDPDAMAHNGAANGDRSGLVIRRPKDYIVPAAAEDEQPSTEGGISSEVKDSVNKICVSHIPLYLTDNQVTELLVAFGELKAFVLVKDQSSEQSRGIAFCEYADPAVTEIAVEGLNGMELGDDHLQVKRASIGVQQAAGLEMSVNAMSMLAGTTATDLEQGRVIQLMNMVTAEELMDNDEYEEICDDVKTECEKFGPVLEVKIPRPSGARTNPGVGKIYVKFAAPESAQKAMRGLAGRKFADRTVVVSYYGEEYFDIGAW